MSSEKITLLYDLKADPSEQNNLADAPPEIVKRLKTEYEILAWSLSKPMIPAIRSTPAEFNGTTVKLIFEKMDIDNKTLVITGAGNGIGRAWALKFASRRGKRSRSCLDKVYFHHLSSMGISTKNVDVRDSKQVTELITDTHAKTGRMDVLFNNAGIAFGPKLENATEGEFEDHIAVHLFGCIYGMRAAIPIMREQGSG